MAGTFGLDGGAMFGVVPKALWAKNLPPDDANRIPMAMRLLLARGHGRTVLVDAGAGGGYDEKSTGIYGFEGHDDMRASLAPAGVTPEEITDVIITHLHFDHGAGVAAAVEGGEGWRLVFPHATHHIQKAQYEHALAPNPRDRASYFKDRITLLENEDALQLHDGPWTLDEGIDVAVFDGHTPGQQLPRIDCSGTTVFFCGDLIPTVHHIPTPYIMSYDLDPVRSMDEKIPILEKAYNEGWLLFFEHDIAVEACKVDYDGKRFSAGETVKL
ncbi:MAG: MBL fold metallo-hydrolase [Candidatus Latescibacterota bacterium]|jgi:glyoxylase-like metal-dependent hydrolase (beta-lactamase superfamily II)